MKGRLPTLEEMKKVVNAKHSKKRDGLFKKGIQWVAVTNKDKKKDWIQVGKKDKTFGKSYLNMNKKYPDWGDSTKNKDQKKAYCYVITKETKAKAAKAKRVDPKKAAMLKRV